MSERASAGVEASTRRASAVFTASVLASNVCQVGWLIAGARALPGGDFGTVLAAQALYGVLQIVVDNGTSFLGARLSARGELTDVRRSEIVRTRLLLAAAMIVLGFAVAVAGGGSIVAAFAPFAGALALFAVLNVWEEYGRGHVLPYAMYLLLRSLILAVVVTAFAAAGSDLPLYVAGLCEVAAVVACGLAFRAWSFPARRGRISRATLATSGLIGAPALITQYNFAIPTVILGVTGRTTAAAVSGVALRLLSGLQGVNGAILAGIFPRLAQLGRPGEESDRTAAWAGAVVVALSAAGLLGAAILAPVLVSGFLDARGELGEQALVVAMSAAGAAALVMQRGYALVAWEQERRLIAAAVAGAVVVTAGVISALAFDGSEAAVVAAAGFVLAQGVTLGLLLRQRGSLSSGSGLDLVVTLGAIVILPLAGLVLALMDDGRAIAAAVVAALSIPLALPAIRRLRAAQR